MKKIGLALLSLYLAVIIMANLFVNFGLERQVNKRRNYFSTQWAITLIPGIFYARNLKFYLYSKNMSLENTVSNSFIILNPLALFKRKVEIKKAYGSHLKSVLHPPLPPLVKKRKPRWEYNLRNITLAKLDGYLNKYRFLGPQDSLKFSILISPQSINIESFVWDFNNSELQGVIKNIQGNFSANYSGQKKFPALLDKVNIDSHLEFKLQSLPGLNEFAQKHKLKFTTTSAQIEAQFKVNQGRIDDSSFLEVEKFTGSGELAKTEVESKGQLSWKQKNKELNISLSPFKVMNEKEELLLEAITLAIKVKSEAIFLKELMKYSEVSISFPDFKVPEVRRWIDLYSTNTQLKGSLDGALNLTMDAKRKKEINASVQFDSLKYKDIHLKGVLVLEGNFFTKNNELNGNMDLDATVNPLIKKPLIKDTKPLEIKAEVSQLKKKGKNISARIDAKMNDNAPLLNMIFEEREKGKIKLHFIHAYETDLKVDIHSNPKEIKLEGIKAKLKASRRFDGDLVYDKKTKKVNGKGKIKVYGVLTPVDIKDNKIKP